jgi:hypothetical protein
MMRRPFSIASVVLALAALPALSGCVFQKQVLPPTVAVAPPPDPTPMPLYTSELAEADTSLPKLPPAPLPAAQPAPPPESEVRLVKKRVSVRRRRDPELAREMTPREKEKESATVEGTDAKGAAPGPDNLAKVTAKAPAADNSANTPIGQVTAGAAQDAPQSRKEAADLIQNTERGVDSLHRGLSGDESKTVTQIHSFLQQAMHALHNGDVDGAFTLATKAKVLLAELTGGD